MYVDAQTLRDLEIFDGRDGRPSIFKWLDTTKTDRGSRRLRQRFRQPSSDPCEIRATHDAIRTIISNREAFRQIPSQYLISGFENYYHWRVTAPASGRGVAFLIDASQIRVDYRQYIQVSTGVRQAAYMVRALDQIVALTANPRGELAKLFIEIRVLLSAINMASLPAKGPDKWHWWSILRADQIFRNERKDEIKRLAEIIAELDALVALADACIDRGFALPEVTDDEAHISASKLYYPLLEDPVTNDVLVDQYKRLVFITGPNMAGKTTYLRACGLSMYLAHVGMGVPAASFRFAPCNTLITTLSLSDDVRAGISFFQAEAIRAREIATAIGDGKRVVAIIDEPFKGTNVRDAFDASFQFLSRLARCRNSLFFVSSHLIELAEALASDKVRCCYFEALEEGKDLQFNYVMNEGVSQQRLGLRVLEDQHVFDVLDHFLRSTELAAAHSDGEHHVDFTG